MRYVASNMEHMDKWAINTSPKCSYLEHFIHKYEHLEEQYKTHTVCKIQIHLIYC
jgi:hypothetical protein